MKNKKICRSNKYKETNTIIEIRKEMLEMMREFTDDLGSKHSINSQEKSLIKAEVIQIAEMIRDKDKLMLKLEDISVEGKNDRKIDDEIIKDTRKKIIDLLRKKKDSVVATQYDSEELEIVENELKDVEKLIIEKDRLIVKQSLESPKNKKSEINPHLKRFFKMNPEPENEL